MTDEAAPTAEDPEVVQTNFGHRAHLYAYADVRDAGGDLVSDSLTSAPVVALCGLAEALHRFEPYDPDADVEWCRPCIKSARKRGVEPLPSDREEEG